MYSCGWLMLPTNTTGKSDSTNSGNDALTSFRRGFSTTSSIYLFGVDQRAVGVSARLSQPFYDNAKAALVAHLGQAVQ